LAGKPPAESVKLFVAIDPPPAAIADLAAVVDRLRVSAANAPGRSTRLTRRDNWHITVAFLGEVPVSRVPVASAVLTEVAFSVTHVHLCICGGGTFGRRTDPILWAGVGGEVDGLRRLARLVQRTLHRARLPVELRRPRPHLTIARPGERVSPADVDVDISTLDSYVGPRWTATELRLMRSDIEQLPTGPLPKYTAIHTAPLGIG
jgi:2'-5' RNA ligase